MSKIAPGIKNILAAIKPLALLRAVLEQGSREFSHKWGNCKDPLLSVYQDIQAYGKGGAHEDLPRWLSILNDLYDITSVWSAYRERSKLRFLVDLLKERNLFDVAIQELGTKRPTAQQLVAWIFVNDHDGLWKTLQEEAVVMDLTGVGGREYRLENRLFNASGRSWPCFRKAFLELMEREQTMVNHVHHEMNYLGVMTRSIFHINPFPHSVEQFQGEELKLLMDLNAERFTIVLLPDDEIIRIKAPFNDKITREIAELYAEFFFGCKITEKPLEDYDVDQLNPSVSGTFVESLHNETVLSCRPCRVEAIYRNLATGDTEHIIHTSKKFNALKCAAKSMCLYQPEWTTIRSVTFEVVIKARAITALQSSLFETKGRGSSVLRTYHVTFSRYHCTSNCYNPEEEKLIAQFFADHGLRNRALP